MRSSKKKGIGTLKAKDRPTTIAIIFVLTFILIITLAHNQNGKKPATTHIHVVEKITGGK